MTTDHRDLITRMAKELDNYRQLLLDDRTVTHRLSDEARAALADGPAVPEGKKPTRDELWELWLRLNNELPDRPAAVAEFWEHAQIDARARAVLAHWGNPAPTPPADGEVAELVAWLRETGDTIQPSHLAEHQRYKRAAELLQRQALVSVPDAERPWEREGWCDELGRCWWGRPDTGDWSADWTLATPEAIAEFCEFSPQTVCLPAHALPLPEVGE